MRYFLKKSLRAAISATCRFSDKHPKTSFAVRSFLTGWSAVLLGYVSIRLSKPLWLQDKMRTWMADHPVIVVVLLVWPLVASFALSWVSDLLDAYRKYNTLRAEDWHTFVKLLNDVVGEKTKRFGQFARGMPSGTTGGNAFVAITQPDSQIEHLVRNLRQLLVLLTGDHTLRVVLATVKGGVPQPDPVFEPTNVVPPADLFGKDAKKTLFCKCAQARKAIVIADVEKELERKGKSKRYVNSTIPEDGYGSIMCQPLIHPYCNQVLFCLSVKSDKKGVVTDAFRRKYLFMIDSFAERILLEASLGMIREGVVQ